jgi:hypothetical protein
MDAIYNERIKLFATFVNSIGIATFAVGGLAPLISTLNGTTKPLMQFVSAICILGAFILHYAASNILTRMKT